MNNRAEIVRQWAAAIDDQIKKTPGMTVGKYLKILDRDLYSRSISPGQWARLRECAMTLKGKKHDQ